MYDYAKPHPVEVYHFECETFGRYVIPEGNFSWFAVCKGCNAGIEISRSLPAVECDARQIDIVWNDGVHIVDCTADAEAYVPYVGYVCGEHALMAYWQK